MGVDIVLETLVGSGALLDDLSRIGWVLLDLISVDT